MITVRDTNKQKHSSKESLTEESLTSNVTAATNTIHASQSGNHLTAPSNPLNDSFLSIQEGSDSEQADDSVDLTSLNISEDNNETNEEK